MVKPAVSNPASQIAWARGYMRDRYGPGGFGPEFLADGSRNPAWRHGGPGAGWYRPAGEGWQRISDAEAAAQGYPDMAHFMHDPNEDQASADLVRAILEAVCERDGIPLESSAEPGEPARNYELALRLKIGKVFGLRETEGSDHGRMDDRYPGPRHP